MPSLYTRCPNCGTHHDTSGRYSSPANQERDRIWWSEEHLSARCMTDAGEDQTRRFNTLKDRLIAAPESPGLTSFHDGSVHMTLGEWQRLIELLEQAEKTHRALSQRTSASFNRAADEVATAGSLAESHVLDAINLVVNAGLHFIDSPEASLRDVIEANYSDAPDTVLSWIQDA